MVNYAGQDFTEQNQFCLRSIVNIGLFRKINVVLREQLCGTYKAYDFAPLILIILKYNLELYV